MTTTTIQLNPSTLSTLKKAFGASSSAYSALISDAARSPYLAGLLNAFAANGGNFSMGEAGAGTRAISQTTILVDPTWLPGSGTSAAELTGIFGTMIGHEIAHAVLPGGFGYIGIISNPGQAAASGRTNEGVALTSEYIVATQLGVAMHSDQGQNASQPPLTPQLNAVALQSNTDVSSLIFNSSAAQRFNGEASTAVAVAGAWNGSSHPSVAPQLTYDQYNADWWTLGTCLNHGQQNVSPLQIQWSKMPTGNLGYQVDSAGTCTYSIQNVPLTSGGNASATGSVSASGIPGPATVTLSGNAGVVSLSNGLRVDLVSNSSAELDGSNNIISESAGDYLIANGGGNMINAAAGAQAYITGTNSNLDTVYANGVQLGGKTANGQPTGILFNTNSGAVVIGSNNGISEATGDYLIANGGGNTVNVAAGAQAYITGTNGKFDTVNADGDKLGGTTANGQPTGILLSTNAQANIHGSNNGVNEAAGDTVGIYGGNNLINLAAGTCTVLGNTNGAFDTINGNGVGLDGVAANGQGTGIGLNINSQANINGSGNGVNETAGDSVGIYGGGNTINTAAGALTVVGQTNGNFDTIHGSGVALGGKTANGQGTGIWLNADAQANVFGDNNGITIVSGDSMGAYGGGNTINAGAGALTVVGQTNGNFDTINANGVALGGKTANGQDTGIWLNADAQANVFGNNNGITIVSGDSMGAYGGGNTINAAAGSLTVLGNTNGVFDTIYADGVALGGKTANGQDTGIGLNANSQANIYGSNNGVNVDAYSQAIMAGNYDTVNGTVGDVFGLTGVGYNINLASNGNSFVNFNSDSTGNVSGSGNTIGIFGTEVQVGSNSNRIVLTDNIFSSVVTDATVINGNGNNIDGSNLTGINELIHIIGDNNVIHVNNARIVVDGANPNSNQIIGTNNRVSSSTGPQNLGHGGIYDPPPPPWHGIPGNGSLPGSRPPDVPPGVSVPGGWQITVGVTGFPSANMAAQRAASNLTQARAAFAPQDPGSLNVGQTEAPSWSSIITARIR